MMGPSHKIIGLATGVAVAGAFNLSPIESPGPFVCTVILSVIGSLLPDADEPNSTIGRALYVVWLPLYIIRGLISVVALIIPDFKKVSKSLAHRGMAHAPLFWAALGFIIWMFPAIREHYIFFLAVFAGILSHLFADFFFGGIPLFFPFSMKRKKPPVCFKTGGYIEFVMVGLSTSWMIFVAVSGVIKAIPLHF